MLALIFMILGHRFVDFMVVLHVACATFKTEGREGEGLCKKSIPAFPMLFCSIKVLLELSLMWVKTQGAGQ